MQYLQFEYNFMWENAGSRFLNMLDVVEINITNDFQRFKPTEKKTVANEHSA